MTTSVADSLVVRATPAGTTFDVRVVARASRSALAGVRDGRLVVRVTAPPVEGAANDAIVRLLADALARPARDVRIRSGLTGRTKTIEVAGIDAAQVRRRLAGAS